MGFPVLPCRKWTSIRRYSKILLSENFDAPCFKVLARNDTASASGHQGGMVIPKAIEAFFPDLTDPLNAARPTRDVELTAELWIDSQFRDIVRTRYQHQTWGNTRSPERRLTGNLALLRREGKAGDIVTFERNLEIENYYRISLVRSETELHRNYTTEAVNRRSGAIGQSPVSNLEMRAAVERVQLSINNDFSLFVNAIERTESRVRKIAREAAFRKVVLNAYNFACSVSNRKIFDPVGAHGLDAAHIVPLSRQGTNDVRNGIALSKELHWAFDRGLIGFTNGRVCISRNARSIEQNNYLLQFEGMKYRLPDVAANQPHVEALDWHLSNIFQQ